MSQKKVVEDIHIYIYIHNSRYEWHEWIIYSWLIVTKIFIMLRRHSYHSQVKPQEFSMSCWWCVCSAPHWHFEWPAKFGYPKFLGKRLKRPFWKLDWPQLMDEDQGGCSALTTQIQCLLSSSIFYSLMQLKCNGMQYTYVYRYRCMVHILMGVSKVMEVPLVIIHLNRDFPCKPSSELGDPHYGTGIWDGGRAESYQPGQHRLGGGFPKMDPQNHWVQWKSGLMTWMILGV